MLYLGRMAAEGPHLRFRHPVGRAGHHHRIDGGSRLGDRPRPRPHPTPTTTREVRRPMAPTFPPRPTAAPARATLAGGGRLARAPVRAPVRDGSAGSDRFRLWLGRRPARLWLGLDRRKSSGSSAARLNPEIAARHLRRIPVRAWALRVRNGESGMLPVLAGLILIIIIFQSQKPGLPHGLQLDQPAGPGRGVHAARHGGGLRPPPRRDRPVDRLCRRRSAEWWPWLPADSTTPGGWLCWPASLATSALGAGPRA